MNHLLLLSLSFLVPVSLTLDGRGQSSYSSEDPVFTPSFPANSATGPNTSGTESTPKAETLLSPYSSTNSTISDDESSPAYAATTTLSTHSIPVQPAASSGSKSSSSKKSSSKSSTKTSTGKASSTSSGSPYASTVPDIDVCGAGSGAGNVSCPGAGANGYYYRCCSGAGHCGPKNSLQAQSLYCGGGCQAGYSDGRCGGSMSPPPNPTGTPGTAQDGETCGPIPNRKCAAGLCCSGSNYCGTGADFCGKANWCQPQFGRCDS